MTEDFDKPRPFHEANMQTVLQGLADFFAGKACIREGQNRWFFESRGD